MNPYAIPGLPHTFTLEEILAHAADVFGVTVEDIKSPTRKQPIIFARHAYFAAAVRHTNFPLVAIARPCGRHHTTVLNSKKAAENLTATNYKDFRLLFNELENRLK
jgi:chromosomal replication initiation ATPase DnaA